MPLGPLMPYVGGQLLAQGLSSFGQSIGNAIQQYQQVQGQTAQADAMMQLLAQTPGYDGKPILDPNAYNRYLHYSGAQRAYAAGGLEAGVKLAQALQSTGIENRLKLAQANYYMDRGNFEPSATAVTNPVTGEKVPVLRTGRGSSQIMPGSSPLAGQGAYDPQGNLIGTYDANGRVIRAAQPNPLLALFPNLGTPVQTGGAQPGGGAPAAPAGTPPPLLARPAPDTTQAPPPAAAPSPAGGGNVAAANQIKAQWQAGQITREQALAQLKALGFQ